MILLFFINKCYRQTEDRWRNLFSYEFFLPLKGGWNDAPSIGKQHPIKSQLWNTGIQNQCKIIYTLLLFWFPLIYYLLETEHTIIFKTLKDSPLQVLLITLPALPVLLWILYVIFDTFVLLYTVERKNCCIAFSLKKLVAGWG